MALNGIRYPSPLLLLLTNDFRRLVSETLGTALLLATVVGSGITGERLSGGKVAIPLLANTMATGAMPVALILTFRPIGVRLIPRLLSAVDQLRQSGLPQLVQLGQTLESWKEEIATIWRFTRNNGITEGFHNKMETISRKAYGFRNFENYRLRVKTFCS